MKKLLLLIYALGLILLVYYAVLQQHQNADDIMAIKCYFRNFCLTEKILKFVFFKPLLEEVIYRGPFLLLLVIISQIKIKTLTGVGIAIVLIIITATVTSWIWALNHSIAFSIFFIVGLLMCLLVMLCFFRLENRKDHLIKNNQLINKMRLVSPLLFVYITHILANLIYFIVISLIIK